MTFAAPQRRVQGEQQPAAPQPRAREPAATGEVGTPAPRDPWTELATILLDMLEDPVAPVPQPDLLGSVPRESEPDEGEAETAPPAAQTARDMSEDTPPDPELPGGTAARLLRGELANPENPEIEVPEFPEGDTALPEGAEITEPPVERQTEASTEAPEIESSGGGGSHRAIVRRWQQGVSRGAGGISTPPVDVPQGPRQALSRTAGAARTRQTNLRRGLTQDALNTVPPAPELDTTVPAPPPPNPVPDHTQRVLALSGKRLPNQSSRALVESEERTIEGQVIGGHLPPLGVEPVAPDLFQVLTTPGARDIGQLPGDAPNREDETPEQARIRVALEKLTEDQEASERRGRGEQVITPDLGPTLATPISEEHQGHVRELVTRLLADPAGTASDVLDRIRKNAYPDEVLMRTYPDAAAEMQDGLQTALQSELRLIADAAGVSGEELDTIVAERRRELEERQREASETVAAEGEAATETVRDEGQQTADAVEGAAEAAEEETLRRQTAIAGEGDPAVINARRDRIVSWFREHITTQITNYQRAGDRRRTELTTARDDQLAGYRTLTQREVYRVLTPEGERPPRDTSDTERERMLSDEVALRRSWRDTQVRAVTEHFRTALSTASTTTRTHRTRIENAGDAGIEAARRWAEDKILENESWWDRFVARIKRWLSEAKDVNENWRVRRGRENRDAITTDLDSVALAHDLLRQGADLNALLAGNQLNDAQKNAIRAYFSQPPGTHPLDFAETRLRANLARDHQQNANEIIERELVAKPVAFRDYTNAHKLNDIAQAQNSSFDARRITGELRGAMDQIGTDEARIYRSLGGLTALQGAVVRKVYMARYGDDLDAELRSELSGEELQRAEAQMEGRQAQADAIALYDAMAGLGTDEAAIMQLLRNKSPAEREAIKAEYLRMYGRTLDADLKDDLSDGNEIDQAQALLRGDTATADAIAIDEAMRGGFLGLGTSEGEITEVQERVRREVLAQSQRENWTSEQMEAEVRRRLGAIETQFGERYRNVEQYNAPGLAGGSVLERAFASELSREELDLANALQDNDLTRADAARIEIERLSFYASDEKINGVLRSQYERALQARRLDEGPARNMRVRREVARWQSEGKTPEEVSRLRMALERRMEREIEDGAQRDSRISMENLQNVYQDRYFWPLDFVIETNTSGEERNKARNMLEQGGRLTALQEIEYATRTAGTDEEALRRVLGRMTKEEIDELEAQWEARNPGRSFEAMLESELSGRDRSDIMDMYEHGVPQSALEQIEQERRRVNREVNELTGVLGGAAAGAEADWMRSEYARLAQLRNDLTRTYPNTAEGRRQRARLSVELDERIQGVQGAVADHRRRIDSVTDTATQIVGIVVAVVVATVVTIATAGTAAPGVIAAIAAVSASVAATASTMATKQLIKGGAYGIEEIGTDIAVGVVDALTAAVTAGMGSRILGPLRSLAAGTKLPALAGRLGQTGFAQRLAATQGRGALARVARNVTPTREGVERAMAGFLAEGVEDAVSSLPSAMGQIALTDTTWQGDPLKNFLEGGGMAIIQSMAMGRTLGAGMGAAGGLRNFGRGLIRGGSDMGRLLELNRLISEGYGTFRQDNPGATIDAFMASPEGRRVAFEIEQRGLMSDLRNVNRAIETDAPSPAARTQAEENAVNTHRGGEPQPVRPPDASPDARAETLRQTLPEGLQDGTFVTPDPALTGRTVEVTPLRIGKDIIGVDIRVGPDATPLDIALHAATVHAMHQYRGLLGQVRRAWHDMMARITRSGWTVGSKAWEAQMEIAKLPAILHERMDALAMGGGTLSPSQRMRLEVDAMSLAAQFHAHEAVVNHPTAGAEPGRGYVAAEDGGFVRDPSGADRMTVRPMDDIETARILDETPGALGQEPDLDARPLTVEDFALFDPGPRYDPEGGITVAGRYDLQMRLEAIREHIRLGRSAGDDVSPALRALIADTADTFGLTERHILDHIYHPEGDADVRSLLTLPETEAPVVSPRHKDEVSDAEFLQRMFDDLVPLDDPVSSAQIFDGIRNGDSEAQAQLEQISAAPEGYVTQDVSWRDMEGMLRGNRLNNPADVAADVGTLRVGEDGVIIIQGRRTASGAEARDHEGNRLIRFRGLFPGIERIGRTVLQLADGRMRIWRTPGDVLILETVSTQSSGKRRGDEKYFETHKEAGLAGPITELAHALAHGLGPESPFGIRRAIYEVNQKIQKDGIEKYIAALRDAAPEGVEFAYRLRIEDQPGDEMRLAAATYAIDMVIDGQRFEFLEFGVHTDPLPPNIPAAEVRAAELIHIDPIERVLRTQVPAEISHFMDVVFGTIRPPGNIVLAGVEDARTRVGGALQDMTREQIASVSADYPDSVRLVEIPPAGTYDMVSFIDQLRGVVYGERPKFVVVDVREPTHLTEDQIKDLKSAMGSIIYGHRGAETFLLEDPVQAP